nr:MULTISPECIES: ABC transporter ATP-binding protein [Myxococcaceae]
MAAVRTAAAHKPRLEPNERPKKVERTTLARIARYGRPYARHAAGAVGLILGASLLNLAPPLLIKRIVDRAIPEADVRQLLVLCALMVAGPLVAGVLGVGQRYLSSLIGERMMFDLRVDLFKQLQKQPMGYFASTRPGEPLSRVLNDVQGVGQTVSKTLTEVVQNAIVLLSTAVAIVWLDWRLALVSLCMLPLFIAPTRRVGKKRKALKRKAQERMGELTGMLSETLSISGVLLLKTFGTAKRERKRLEAKSRELMELSLEQTLVGRWFQMLLGLFETLGPAMVFAVGGYLVIEGHAALGTLVAFVTLLRRLYPPASALAGVHVDLVTSYAYFDRVFSVLDLEPAIRDLPGARKLESVEGDVRFEGVSFAYGEQPTLADVDLHVKPGQTIALVGPSGAGKSTVSALLARLYEPTKGRVLLDGQDIRGLKLKSLRSQIGVVTQETYLFHGTLLENLRYGRPDATDEEVVAAARAAQIHDFISQLPGGYQTVVGERGTRLSGGERQRVAIARAVLKNPRILILDEATSALDSQNEALVQKALQPLLRGRTCLVIAHRLSTVREADQIAVLEKGRVVERGTFDELLTQGGLFAALYHEQFRELRAA